MSKKVLIELAKLKNFESGLGQTSYHLANSLSQQLPKWPNLELTYFVPPTHRKNYDPSIEIIVPRFYHKLFPPTKGIDVWHAFHQDTPYFPFSSKAKIILTIHDLNFLREKKDPVVVGRKLTALQKKIDRSHKLIAVSEFTKNEVLERLKVRDCPFEVIHWGLNKGPTIELQKPHFVQSERFLFSLGIIAPKKNFHVLLWILKEQPDLQLIIAGPDQNSYATEIKKMAIEMGLEKRLHLPGKISEDEKQWLFAHCEAFLFPSLAEGFGIPVLEALRAERPVFCSGSTSLPEMAGPFAYYWENFSPDHLNQVFRDGMKAHAEGKTEKLEKLKHWLKKFDWNECASRYLRSYQDL